MTYRIGDTVTVVGGTGTISITGVNITGSGTNFDPEIYPGAVIHTGTTGQTLVIATRTNDTAATVVTAPVVTVSGETFTITAMADVSGLVADAVAPLGSYYRWLETKPLANGLERALGRPRASWLFKNPSISLRAALLGYCPSKSVRVYICTLTDPSNNTFATYLASMLWPDTDNAYNQEFVIEFKDLVAL